MATCGMSDENKPIFGSATFSWFFLQWQIYFKSIFNDLVVSCFMPLSFQHGVVFAGALPVVMLAHTFADSVAASHLAPYIPVRAR